MKRIAVRTLAVVGAALLAACGLVAWLALTESGLLTAWRLAAPLLPRALAVGAVDGRLAGPIVLRDVVYRDDAWSATISRVELEWRPSRLLVGALDVERLLASDVELIRLRSAEPETA
ncbi:MAG: hypothetical protein LOD94_16715, partial [Gammaproteobacteria bacterium]